MSAFTNLSNDPELLIIKTRDDEIKDLNYKTEKHGFENILISLKIDNEHYKKKYKRLNEKKVFMIVSENLIGSAGLGVGSGLTESGLAPVGITSAGSISFLSTIRTLITNEFFSNLKIRYTKLGDWTNVINFLYEKTLKQSMIDKETDQKGAQKWKKIYNHYLDKRKETVRNTQFKVEDIFDDNVSKDSISPEQLAEPNNFSARIL